MTAAPLVAAPWPSVSAEEASKAAEKVSIETSDGATLDGRVFTGTGPTAVVLSHMGDGPNNQSDWFVFASALASEGYTAITFNRRGLCPGGLSGCSTGTDDPAGAWRDVAAAVKLARERGATTVIVAGASLGAATSLEAALQPGSAVNGVVWIAGSLASSWGDYSFTADEVGHLQCPVLIMVADHDPLGLFVHARILDGYVKAPKRLVFLESNGHGTDMLADGSGSVVAGEVLGATLELVRSASPDVRCTS